MRRPRRVERAMVSAPRFLIINIMRMQCHLEDSNKIDMSTYIKLKDDTEYCVSDDGQHILRQHLPSGLKWTRAYNIPSDKKVSDFRVDYTGANVEVLFSDGRWYEDNGHGFLRLTLEEREKDRQTLKVHKEEKTTSKGKNSSNGSPTKGFNLFHKSSSKNRSLLENDDNVSNLNSDEIPEVSEQLLGEDYDSLNHKDQTAKILSLYKSHKISQDQAIDQLEWIIGKYSYDVDDFVEDFTKQMYSVSISEWTQKFIDKFSDIIHQQIHEDSLFPELKKEFEDKKNIDESIKPSGFLDFRTKNRNKRVESLKDKRSSLRRDINYIKIRLRNTLISIMGKLEELLQYEKSLNDMENQTPTSKGLLSGLKEKKIINEKKKDIKENIKATRDRIQSTNKDVREVIKDLTDKSESYNKINKELLGLTSAERYKEDYVSQGEGIRIAKVLANNIKITDSKELLDLFKSHLYRQYL